jgi:lysozyme family protein
MISPAIIQEIVRDEERREGGDKVTNDPADSGGLTQFGLTKKDNPEEWADGVVTQAEADKAFEVRYVRPFEGIRDTGLLHQLVDFGINAGPQAVVTILQQLVGVNADGVIGPKTIAAVESFPRGTVFGVDVPGFVMLNLAVRDARVLFYAGLTKRWPKNLKFIMGWLRRALEFK